MKKILTILGILAVLNLSGQDTIKLNIKVPKIVIIKQTDTSVKKVNDFQMTFIYPIGTNGVEAINYTNHFSINVFAGLNGGVDGVELGGFLNMNNGDVKGLQIAGLGNFNRGSVEGTQLSALMNANSANYEGVQLSGYFNVNGGRFEGFQLTGLSNFNIGNFEGASLAGISNFNARAGNGFQGAGIVNFNTSSFSGCQIASICNVNTAILDTNFSELVQISGVFNITTSKFDGAQIASCLNASLDTINGVQIGLVNIAKHVYGTQIGLLNICLSDTVDVFPVGLVNIVKKGLHQIELSSNDLIYANLNLKLGVNAFYTIFKTGYTLHRNKQMFLNGLGLGSSIKLTDKSRIHLEFSSANINDFKFKSLSLLSQIQVLYQYKFAKHFAFNIGPTYNNLFLYRFSTETEDLLVPLYTLRSLKTRKYSIYDWIGASIGLVFIF